MNNSLEHYGVKGMKWGKAKKKVTPNAKNMSGAKDVLNKVGSTPVSDILIGTTRLPGGLEDFTNRLRKSKNSPGNYTPVKNPDPNTPINSNRNPTPVRDSKNTPINSGGARPVSDLLTKTARVGKGLENFTKKAKKKRK